MITDDVKQKLRENGARESEIRSIERLVDTSSVFCYAKPHADKFSEVCERGTMVEIKDCLKSIIDGLSGWRGDTAKEHKGEARRWAKRVPK